MFMAQPEVERASLMESRSGNLARRGIWSHAGPASLATRISTVVEFLDACHSHHPRCLQATKDHVILPSRFVDVGSRDGSVEPRLVSCSGISTTVKYTTLSHCWGAHPDNMPLRTTRSTAAAHVVSIPMATLPKTFRDAVSVTRALDIRYIWIDSLCIVQDDLQDWEQEAAKMASIYEGSFLTIAAVDSPNSNGGLFLDSITPPAHFNFTPRVASGGSATFPRTQSTAFARQLLQTRSNDDKLHLHNAPLYQRGWVFQELRLSPRSIHFREHQMYWKCHSGLRSEDGTLDESGQKHGHSSFFSRAGEIQDDLSSPLGSTETWWRWVNDYTTRSLTRSQDRVAAITGMIRYFQRLTRDTPMLGLWERSFICDLHWSVSGEVANTPPTGPSWSWLSLPGQEIFNQKFGKWFDRESDRHEPRLERFKVQWTGSPFTSKLVSSTLHVSGVVRTFKVTKPRWEYSFHVIRPDSPHLTEEVDCTLDNGTKIFDGLYITCLFLFYDTEHIDTDGPNGELIFESRRWEYFLIISPHRPSGLSALEPIVISDSDDVTPAAYRRLGVGSFELELVPKNEWARISDGEYDNTSWPNPPLMFDGAERVTIELV
jgi:hypothetical protein